LKGDGLTERRQQVEEQIAVCVCAGDPISRAGGVAQLQARPEVCVLDDEDVSSASVTVVIAEQVDQGTVQLMKAVQRHGCGRIVLVLGTVDDAGLFAAVEAGACAIVRRSEGTTDALVQAVASAAVGEGTMPPDLLGRLLNQVGRLHEQVLGPRGLTVAGLAQREIDVLKLVAEGLSTGDIARRLCYSERTIKNVIHDVTARFDLQNRCHAVAYAMRAGLI
jgi:DNA-binding NarL/FixJ family response regulator